MHEVVEDAVLDNIKHLNIRYAPIFHTKEGLTAE